MQEIRWRKNTHGMTLDIETDINLTGWTELKVHFRDPDTGGLITKTSGSGGVDDTGTPTDGKVRYVIESGLLSKAGKWQAVPEVNFTGKVYKGETAVIIEVLDDFDPQS